MQKMHQKSYWLVDEWTTCKRIRRNQIQKCRPCILSRFYPVFIQILSRLYPDFILILSRFFKNLPFSDFIQILSWFYLDQIWIKSGHGRAFYQRNWDIWLLFNFAKSQFLNDRIYEKTFGKIDVLVNFTISKLSFWKFER